MSGRQTRQTVQIRRTSNQTEEHFWHPEERRQRQVQGQRVQAIRISASFARRALSSARLWRSWLPLISFLALELAQARKDLQAIDEHVVLQKQIRTIFKEQKRTLQWKDRSGHLHHQGLHSAAEACGAEEQPSQARAERQEEA